MKQFLMLLLFGGQYNDKSKHDSYAVHPVIDTFDAFLPSIIESKHDLTPSHFMDSSPLSGLVISAHLQLVSD